MSSHSPFLDVREWRVALVSAAALGLLSAIGDWIWYRFLTDGDPVAGVGHGVVFFVALALVLGWSAGNRPVTRRLLLALPVAGLVIAAAFYPLYFVLGYMGSLLATWVLMWLSLAFAQRWARREGETWQRASLRGVLAAIGSGLAFYAVSDMWTAPKPGPPDLLAHSWRWAVAFLPGLVALGLGHGRTEAKTDG